MKIFKFDKLFKDTNRERYKMSNKKVQKIIVYIMVAIMIISTIAMGVALVG